MIYYLNSRYYNSEWGRFINGDSITADAGELLSGNMFAYCKNNPVNMEDDDGTRPMPINGDQSPEITQVSCEIMNSWVQRTYHPSAYHPSSSSNTVSKKKAPKGKTNYFNEFIGNAAAGSGISSGLDAFGRTPLGHTNIRIMNTDVRVPITIDTFKGWGEYLKSFSLVSLYFSLKDDIKGKYHTGDKWIRAGIDIGVEASAFICPEGWAGVAVAFLIGVAAEAVKERVKKEYND